MAVTPMGEAKQVRMLLLNPREPQPQVSHTKRLVARTSLLGGCSKIRSEFLTSFLSVVHNLFCQLHDFKGVLLLALLQQFSIEGIIDSHGNQPHDA